MKRRGSLAALLLCLPLFAAADVRLRTSPIDGATGIQLVGDFNGDGLDDIFFRDRFHYNLGGRFGPAMDVNGIPASNPDHDEVGVRGAGDFNGDGLADLYVAHESAGDLLLLGSATGSFGTKSVGFLDGYGADIVDFTGDGIPDVLTWKPGQVLMHRNTGDGSFVLHQTIPFEGQWWQQEIPSGDINGDGRFDVLLRTDDSLVFLLAQADGTFVKRERYTRFGPVYAQIGDVNGDGKADVGFLSLAQDQLAMSVLYGDGTGRFPGYTRLVLDPAAHWYGLSIGDFVPGGAQELAYGTQKGTVVLLSGMNGQLREVARARVEGYAVGVQKMRFRSSEARELMAIAQGRVSTDYQAFSVATEGAIDSVQTRKRGRAMGRMVPHVMSGTFRLDLESDCPIPGLVEWTFDREGLFVDFETSDMIQSAKGAFLPNELYVVLQVKDGSVTRELSGSLVPTTDGLKGKLFEWKPSPCGRWEAHKVTAVPMR